MERKWLENMMRTWMENMIVDIGIEGINTQERSTSYCMAPGSLLSGVFGKIGTQGETVGGQGK